MMTLLSMTGEHHKTLMEHLFPEDGCEAVAIALCGRAKSSDRQKLLVHRLILVPYSSCSSRTPNQVQWPTDVLVPLLVEAEKHDLAIVKFHGHNSLDCFSSTDDAADRALFPSIYAWVNSDAPHGSAIVMRNGMTFGRVVGEDKSFQDIHSVHVAGDDISIFHRSSRSDIEVPDFAKRILQTFGSGTFALLSSLKIGVIGCSGTGSPVIEQLARSGVGELVLVDPDFIEKKNLNRIINATMRDAENATPKVSVAHRAIAAMGLGTKVTTIESDFFDCDVVRELSSCDAIFGCMDTIDGRHTLNKLATFYLIPFLDLGVKIEADGKGGVDQVCGSVHYIKPGGSSLLSRNVFNLEQVRAAGLQRTQPDQYQELLDAGYIRGINEDRPAVIQLNSLIASLAVCEFLARVHPYRSDPNEEYATTRVSLVHGIFEHEGDGPPCKVLLRHVGRGDVNPLLDAPELSFKKKEIK
jgi:hypothetical protein